MTQGIAIREQNETMSGEEIRLMARTLTNRYSDKAADVARHFAQEHKIIGDFGRADAWRRVALCVENAGVIPTLS